MLPCPYCSHPNNLSVTHCLSCGADLNEPVSVPSSDSLDDFPSSPPIHPQPLLPSSPSLTKSFSSPAKAEKSLKGEKPPPPRMPAKAEKPASPSSTRLEKTPSPPPAPSVDPFALADEGVEKTTESPLPKEKQSTDPSVTAVPPELPPPPLSPSKTGSWKAVVQQTLTQRASHRQAPPISSIPPAPSPYPPPQDKISESGDYPTASHTQPPPPVPVATFLTPKPESNPPDSTQEIESPQVEEEPFHFDDLSGDTSRPALLHSPTPTERLDLRLLQEKMREKMRERSPSPLPFDLLSLEHSLSSKPPSLEEIEDLPEDSLLDEDDAFQSLAPIDEDEADEPSTRLESYAIPPHLQTPFPSHLQAQAYADETDTQQFSSAARDRVARSTETEPSSASSSGPSTQDNLLASSPQEGLLCIQLDVERTRHPEAYDAGQAWLFLREASETIAHQLRKAGLTLDEQQPSRLLARSTQGEEGILLCVSTAQEILASLHERSSYLLEWRLRLRCLITLSPAGLLASSSPSLRIIERLLEGMPLDRLWLDWHASRCVADPIQIQEILLPTLEEPAYEVALPTALDAPPTTALDAASPEGGFPLLGREPLLAELDRFWREVEAGAFHVACILGPPGSGRSRLAQAWFNRLKPQATVFWGASDRCPPNPTASPYLASLFHSHLQIHQIQGQDQLYQHISRLVASTTNDPSWQTWIAALFDLFTPILDLERPIEDAFLWYLQTASSELPALLILDDIFLMDRRASRTLDAILRSRPPHTLLLVLTSPGEYESLFLPALPPSVRLEIPRLTTDQAFQIAHSVASSLTPDQATQIPQIVEDADGNPQLLLTLLRSLQRQGEFQKETTLAQQNVIPGAIEGLLLKRLQRLSFLEQDTLRKASLVGEHFWPSTIESLERMELPDGSWSFKDGEMLSTVDDRSDVLRSLETKQLLERLPSSRLQGEIEYRFHHRMLRSIMLQQFPPPIRALFHRRIAEWMILHPSSHVLLQDVIEHLKAAGEKDLAAQYLARLAQTHLDQNRYQDALRALHSALEEIGDGLSSSRLRWLSLLADTYLHLGDLTAAIHIYQQALQLSWRFNQLRLASSLFLSLGRALLRRQSLPQAESAFRNALAIAQKFNDTHTQDLASLALVQHAFAQDKLDHARNLLQDLLHHPRLCEALPTSVHLLQANLAKFEARWPDAERHLKAACAIAQTPSSPPSSALDAARLTSAQGELLLLTGKEDAALDLLTEADAIFLSLEAFSDRIQNLLLKAHALLLRRDSKAMLQHLQYAWAATQITGSEIEIAQVASALAAAHALLQQPNEASHYSQLAEQKWKNGSPLERGLIYYFLGEAAASLPLTERERLLKRLPDRLPDGGLSTFLFLKAVEFFQTARDKARHTLTLLALSRSLMASGLRQIASNVIERASREAQQCQLTVLLERIQNQQRLLLPEEPAPPPPSFDTDHSTLVVRRDRPKRRPDDAPKIVPKNVPTPHEDHELDLPSPSSASSSNPPRPHFSGFLPPTPEPPLQRPPSHPDFRHPSASSNPVPPPVPSNPVPPPAPSSEYRSAADLRSSPEFRPAPTPDRTAQDFRPTPAAEPRSHTDFRPSPASDFRTTGSIQPTPDFRTTGSIQPTPDFRTTGSIQPAQDFRTTGSIQPTPDFRPTPASDFRTTGSIQPASDFRSTGSVQPMPEGRPPGNAASPNPLDPRGTAGNSRIPSLNIPPPSSPPPKKR